jgi:hypothetical protein
MEEPMKPETRRTLFSILILAGVIFTLLDGVAFHANNPLSSLPMCLTLGLAAALWIKGIRGAGSGWRRMVFLTAFAAPIIYLGLSIAGGAHDFFEGFQLGLHQGTDLAAQERIESGQPPQSRKPMPPNPFPVMPSGIQLVSWLVLTTVFAALLHRLEQRGAEAERQAELAKTARGQALAARLAPHFIFNALNILHAQIEVDSKGAQATTERLADLFRQMVAVVAQSLIPLRQELAFVEAYLGIEQARLGKRLRVSIQVPEELESTEIPPLSLQVLVENAIKHGVAPLEQGGEVRIGVEKRAGFLHLWVEDPGSGISLEKGTGTALDTLRQRLERPEDLEMGNVEGRHQVSFRWRQA